MSSSTYSPSADTRAVNWGRYALVGLATIAVAVLANVLVYLVGNAIVGFDTRFLPLANVSPAISFTVVPAIVAVLLYAVLLRVAADPARTFTIIAAVVLVLSLIPDLFYIPTVPYATTAQTATLMVMHVVAAVAIVLMLTAFARPRAG